jgi:hypothetical protein
MIGAVVLGALSKLFKIALVIWVNWFELASQLSSAEVATARLPYR